MDETIDKIYEVIKDYHCDECKPLDRQDIQIWIKQFDTNDQLFVLEELNHLLKKGIYLSKSRASDLLWNNFKDAANKLGYKDLKLFASETHFFNLQPTGKSQPVLLDLLNCIVEKNIGQKINLDTGHKTKNFIYIDDIVATGKTLLNHLREWLSQNDNFNKVVSGEFNCIISVFAMHSWAYSNIKWILRCNFNNEDTIMSKIKLISNVFIDNHVRFPSAALNLAYPLNDLSKKSLDYFNNLTATDHEDRAFRNVDQPKIESFFSSKENRIRFESILIDKGVEILQKVKKINPAHRPLGSTYPNYKTMGTGTLFFTWRNVSNTCPLVFWWDNPAHDWKSLFSLKGRGI